MNRETEEVDILNVQQKESKAIISSVSQIKNKRGVGYDSKLNSKFSV